MKRTRFSDQIRRAIAGSGMSQRAICKTIGIDPSTLSRFMSGERGILMKDMETLAELLDLNVVAGRQDQKAKRSGRRSAKG